MRYKLFGNSGLKVSELCLGTMQFGTEWGYGADKEESYAQFKAFRDAGGNFFDTANRYTEGTSERYLGEFAAGEREQVVLATKYSLRTDRNGVLDGGNSRKNLVQSVEGSLKRLGTDYIDVLYVHMWDFTTPEQEVMRSLDDLVRSGKVLYLGISDTPAWIVSKCNTLSELMGWTSFVGMQVEYSLIARTPERELIPMAKAHKMAVTSWGAMGGGVLCGKYLSQGDDPRRLKEGTTRLTEANIQLSAKLVSIGQELGASAGQVALAWVRQQFQLSIPLIAGRTAMQITENAASVNVTLSDNHLAILNDMTAIDLGFPHKFLQEPGVQDVLYNGYRDQIDFSR